MIPIYRFLREIRNSCQIMFHNVQSLWPGTSIPTASPGFGLCVMLKHNVKYSNPPSHSEITGTDHCEAIPNEIN